MNKMIKRILIIRDKHPFGPFILTLALITLIASAIIFHISGFTFAGEPVQGNIEKFKEESAPYHKKMRQLVEQLKETIKKEGPQSESVRALRLEISRMRCKIEELAILNDLPPGPPRKQSGDGDVKQLIPQKNRQTEPYAP